MPLVPAADPIGAHVGLHGDTMKQIQGLSIDHLEGENLRRAWRAKGNQQCSHRHLAIERSASDYATGFYVCKTCGARTPNSSISIDAREPDQHRARARLTAAFLGGAMIGAAVAVLNTPEGGAAVRRRLSRSVKNLRTEMPVLVTDAREAYAVLAKDARQACRRTACRLASAVRACLDAIKKGSTNL